MKAWFCLGILMLAMNLNAQQKTKNIIVVTLDGMRWEEVFKGADEVLINDSTFTEDRKGLKDKFWVIQSIPFTQNNIYGKRKSA